MSQSKKPVFSTDSEFGKRLFTYLMKGKDAMLEKQTKNAYQAMINDKTSEKRKCIVLQTKLKGLKKDIACEMKEWGKNYKKHNQYEATKDVVKRGRFEGKNAEKTRKLYHTGVQHMNGRYLQKITKVCEDLDAQIANIDAYIRELDKSIGKIQKDMNSLEG